MTEQIKDTKPKIEQPEFMTLIYAVDRKDFKTYMAVDKVPPFLAQFLKPEAVIDFPCDCGCGQTYQVVLKESIDKIIEELKAERVASQN